MLSSYCRCFSLHNTLQFLILLAIIPSNSLVFLWCACWCRKHPQIKICKFPMSTHEFESNYTKTNSDRQNRPCRVVKLAKPIFVGMSQTAKTGGNWPSRFCKSTRPSLAISMQNLLFSNHGVDVRRNFRCERTLRKYVGTSNICQNFEHTSDFRCRAELGMQDGDQGNRPGRFWLFKCNTSLQRF